MTIPDYQSIMLPVLRAAVKGEVQIADVVERLSEELGLTDEERRAPLPSGRQTVFANRVHWAKSYLKQAALIEAVRRGVFRLSERGRTALASGATRIDNDYLSQFPEFQAFKERARLSQQRDDHEDEQLSVPEPEKDSPEDMLRTAHKRVEDELKAELIDRVLAAKPEFFERLIVRLLTQMGYGGSVANAGRAIGGSGDGGVDGVIDQDTLGLDRVYIQAKRYAHGNNIGAAAIRDFFGSLDRHKASKGVFVTTSDFSKDARETGQQLSKRIVLIDGLTLAQLMVRFGVGCQVEETFRLQRLDEDFFDDI
ncbi:MAG: restriction endonuclease [Alphaproteobacteria bacterium]|nr:restriction endonuclease [Alphaproteobacteria bacterium]